MTDEQDFNQNRDRIVRELTSESQQAAHIYTIKLGVAFELRRVSPVVIRRMEKDAWGKPQPPIVESQVGPQRRKVKEANPDDPDYKAALAAWQEDHNENMLIYLFSQGICQDPSDEEIVRLRQFLPGATPAVIKYSWIMEMLADDEEIADLAAVVMGQSIPTERGIRASEERFRSDGERQSDP